MAKQTLLLFSELKSDHVKERLAVHSETEYDSACFHLRALPENDKLVKKVTSNLWNANFPQHDLFSLHSRLKNVYVKMQLSYSKI